MVRDAEAHAEEDKKRRELVETRNEAEALVHATEKALMEHGGKVGDADRRSIETAMEDLKSAIAGDDVGRIRAKVQALSQSSQKLGQAAYGAAQGSQPAPGAEMPSPEDVVDAEFEEVDEPQKRRRG
jgi:molecular chaperone DnaK